MTIEVEVQYGTGRTGLPRPATVANWVRAALRGRRRNGQLTVRFVDGGEGAQLNQRWRGRRGATNVLSFATDGVEGVAPELLGDIVVCVPVVIREAAMQCKSVKAHFAHMVVHGSLHLLGLDHGEEAQAEVMEKMETAILRRLGYPDPYQPVTPA